MSITYYEVEPCESLRMVIDNYFVIEYDSDELRMDYLLPNGLPSFSFLQCPGGLDTAFYNARKNVRYKDGVYLGYGKNLMRYSHRRMRVVGASMYPVFFRQMFKKPLGDVLNAFVPLESIGEFQELKWPLGMNEMETCSIVAIMENFLLECVGACDFEEELVKVYHKLVEPNGYMNSVEDLASWLGFSTRYIGKLFNRHLGMSPKQFLKIVRFNKALKLMSEMGHEKNLSHVAHETGYHDQAHFIRDFKLICGITPKELVDRPDSLIHQFRLFKRD